MGTPFLLNLYHANNQLKPRLFALIRSVPMFFATKLNPAQSDIVPAAFYCVTERCIIQLPHDSRIEAFSRGVCSTKHLQVIGTPDINAPCPTKWGRRGAFLSHAGEMFY